MLMATWRLRIMAGLTLANVVSAGPKAGPKLGKLAMGKWDVILPFLAPNRGTPEPLSRRDPVSGHSSPSSDGSEMPVEEIYDLKSSELVDLEECLGLVGAKVSLVS